MRTILLLFYVSLNFIACSSSKSIEPFVKSDLEKRGLKGNITTIETEIFDATGEKGTSCLSFDRSGFLRFDKNGFLLEEVDFDANGDTPRHYKYSYNPMNQIKRIVEKDYNDREETTSVREFFYNKNDSLERFIQSDENHKRILILKRDSDEKVVRMEDSVNGKILRTTTYQFDHEGNVIETSEFGEDNDLNKRIIKSYENGLLHSESTAQYTDWDTIQSKTLYEYDNQQRIIKIKSDYQNEKDYILTERDYNNTGMLVQEKVTPIGSTRFSIITQKWNDYGDMIEHKITDGQTGTEQVWTFDFEYDEQQNWVTKKSYKGSELLCIVKRKIQYK